MAFCSSSLVVNAASVRVSLRKEGRGALLTFFTQSGLHTDFASGQARNTTVQVWTIGEGFGIGSEFRQTCCAANNFRDHEVLFSLVQTLQSRMEPESSSRGALKKRPHFG